MGIDKYGWPGKDIKNVGSMNTRFDFLFSILPSLTPTIIQP